MTNHWRDFKNSDVILVIGANPAENHPCGWKWAHVGRDERGTKIIHVDPRFTRTSAIADVYAPIRAGTDVAFFGGLINYVLEHKLYHEDYVKLHTNAAFIVASGYQFNDGLFSGYDETKRTYDPATWDYDRLPPVSPPAPGGAAPAAGGQPPGSSGGASALGPAAGRRRQRRAGPRQHSGEHRQRHQLGDLPRLPRRAQAGHEHHGRLHVEGAVQGIGPQRRQLLRHQLQEVHGVAAQGLVRRRRPARQRLPLQLAAEAGQELVVADDP